DEPVAGNGFELIELGLFGDAHACLPGRRASCAPRWSDFQKASNCAPGGRPMSSEMRSLTWRKGRRLRLSFTVSSFQDNVLHFIVRVDDHAGLLQREEPQQEQLLDPTDGRLR